MTHPVYPGGPLCQPNCPGPSSMYHDGYADGYDAGERAVAAELRAKVEALPWQQRHRNGLGGMVELVTRHAVLALIEEVAK